MNSHINPSSQQIGQQLCKLKIYFDDFKGLFNLCQKLSLQLNYNFVQKEELQRFQNYISKNSFQPNIQTIQLVINKIIVYLRELLSLKNDLLFKKELNQRRKQKYTLEQFQSDINLNSTSKPHKQSNIQHIQRLTSHLTQLKKGMHTLANQPIDNKSFIQIIRNQKQFMDQKQRLQRLKMRNQEIMKVLEKRVDQQVQHFFNHLCQKVQDNQEYMIVKVYQKDFQRFTKQYQIAQLYNRQDIQQVRLIQQQFIGQYLHNKPELTQLKHSKQIDERQNDIKNYRQSEPKKLSFKKSSAYSPQIILKTQQVNKRCQNQNPNLSSIDQIRLKRRKLFQDQIWKQFQKI